jgi:uncharacterized membrane protein
MTAPQPGAAAAPAVGRRLSDIDWMKGLAILIRPMLGMAVLRNAGVALWKQWRADSRIG